LTDNGSERLARMEEAITTMATAITHQSEVNTTMATAITHQSEVNTAMSAAITRQAEVTARGFDTLSSMHRVLETRMTVLENQLGEVIVELRSQARRMDDLITEFRAHGHEAA